MQAVCTNIGKRETFSQMLQINVFNRMLQVLYGMLSVDFRIKFIISTSAFKVLTCSVALYLADPPETP